MKLAYLILAHRLPEQLARLIRALGEDDAYFVHVDLRSDSGFESRVRGELHDRYQLRFVQRQRCYWGAFSIVQATIQAIGELLGSGVPYERVLLLSGQDYPIKSNAYTKSFLARHRDREFIESFLMTAPNKWSAHRGAYRDVNRILYWHLNYRSRFLHLPLRRRFLAHMQPYGGSQWWCLSRACIEYVHRFVRENPRYLSYFKHTFIPDELFFHTIISNSPFKERVAGHHLTYEDWGRPQPPYPAVFGQADLPRLLASDKLFARKLDVTQDSGILDAIDQRLQPAPLARRADTRLRA